MVICKFINILFFKDITVSINLELADLCLCLILILVLHLFEKKILSIKAYHNNSLIFFSAFEVYSIILNFNTVLQILVKHLTQN